MKRTNKANGIRSAVPRLTDYMRSSMGVIILALILAALSAVMTILGPNQIGRIATLMSDGLTGNIDLAAIAKVGISGLLKWPSLYFWRLPPLWRVLP